MYLYLYPSHYYKIVSSTPPTYATAMKQQQQQQFHQTTCFMNAFARLDMYVSFHLTPCVCVSVCRFSLERRHQYRPAGLCWLTVCMPDCVIVFTFQPFSLFSVCYYRRQTVLLLLSSSPLCLHAFPPSIQLTLPYTQCVPQPFSTDSWHSQSVLYSCRLSTYIHLLLQQEKFFDRSKEHVRKTSQKFCNITTTTS